MARSSDAIATIAQRVDAEDGNDTMACNITDAGTSLKFASLALRSCYSVNASSIQEFVDLRASMTNSAMVYKSKVLPLAKASLQQVKDFVIYFQDLSFEECLSIASDIVTEAKANRDLMLLNRDTHKAMAVTFKQMDGKVSKVLKTCELEQKKYEAKAADLRKTAKTKTSWATGLSFIPVVGLIATPLLLDSANSDYNHAVAAKEEAELAVAASMVVKDTLAVAIAKYCFAMDRCAGEFEKIASECETFASQGEKFKESQKRAFYLLMQKRATAILESVREFQMVAVSAETDLECLPAAADPNYVQQWLATQQVAGADQPTFLERMRALKEKITMPALTDLIS